MKNKVIIFGNGLDNWIIKEAFYDIFHSEYENVKWVEPYCFTKEKKMEYYEMFFTENRKHLAGIPASRWRRYSNALNFEIEPDTVFHFFFMYGRDIQRLYDPTLLEWLKEKYGKSVMTYLILFDSINVTRNVNGWGGVTSIFESFDYVCSFDPDDCDRYNLIPFVDPFPVHKVKKSSRLKSDLFFIGEEKGRGPLLKEIAESAVKNHIKYKFIVPDIEKSGTVIPGVGKSDYLPYSKMQKIMVNSTCLLELVADGQSGCSYRYYEAVVYNKKLISNCRSIEKMPYYNPRFMKIIKNAEEIDYNWITNGEPVDYHYKGTFTVNNFAAMILREAAKREACRKKQESGSTPLISVIIPVYNRERTIEKALMSVLDQTYKNLEVIVVDDGSTDQTKAIILKQNDPRIRLISQENQGACVARNTGIEAASGTFIAFQDSDDEWLADKLEKQMKVFQKEPGTDVVFCNAIKYISEIDKQGEKLVTDKRTGFVTRDDLQKRSLVSTQTMLLRSICLNEIRFDPQMPRLQDFDLVYRLCESFSFFYLNEPLVNMYVQSDSISCHPEKSVIARRRMIEKYPYVMKRNIEAHIDMLSMIVRNSKLLGTPDKDAEDELQHEIQEFKYAQGNRLNKLRGLYFRSIHFLETHLPEKEMETLRRWYQPIKRIIFRLPKET